MKGSINKRNLTTFALAMAFTAIFSVTASAQTDQKGGAAGLVAAVVQIATDDTLQNNGTVDVRVIQLDRSLNNLKALNNVIKNSPVLSKNNVNVTVQDIQALNDNTVLTDFLKNNNIAVGEVVGVSVLSGGDIIVFQQGKEKKSK